MNKITLQRHEEIATVMLHRLMEIDRNSAHHFMIDEVDMDAEEAEHYGVLRHRTATEIEWDIDEDDEPVTLPSEVEIPWEVFDDDIDDYLSDEYGFCVGDFEVEEDDE